MHDPNLNLNFKLKLKPLFILHTSPPSFLLHNKLHDLNFSSCMYFKHIKGLDLKSESTSSWTPVSFTSVDISAMRSVLSNQMALMVISGSLFLYHIHALEVSYSPSGRTGQLTSVNVSYPYVLDSYYSGTNFFDEWDFFNVCIHKAMRKLRISRRISNF